MFAPIRKHFQSSFVISTPVNMLIFEKATIIHMEDMFSHKFSHHVKLWVIHNDWKKSDRQINSLNYFFKSASPC